MERKQMEQNINPQYPQNVQVIDFNSILIKMSKDMNFLAIVLIVYGAITCLSIIGAIFGIPYIFAGIRMKEAAFHFKNFTFANNITELHHAVERQQRMFFIFKVLAIVGIIFAVLLIIFYVTLISMLLSGNFPVFENFYDAV